jgi:hypothetical protein
MSTTLLHLPRLSWSLRQWLLPTVWLAAIMFGVGCGFASTTPPTLKPQSSTPTAIPLVAPSTTPTIPSGGIVGRPSDPALMDILDLVQSDSLMLTVDSLVGMGSRHVLSHPSPQIKGIAGARDWLLSQFNGIARDNPQQSINIWAQNFQYNWNGFNIEAQNVAAVFQGTDVGAGVVILGAHYDSITTNFTNGQTAAPGANDNGSGIAAMMEVARIMARAAHRATIIFVAFAAEETGRQGSLAFIKDYLQAQNPPVDVRGMINMDIIGSEQGANGQVDRRTLRIFSAPPNDSPSRQLARQIALGIKTYFDEIDPIIQSSEERTGRWGDHQSFRAAGYPSVRFIQGLEDVSHQHSPRDIADNIQPAYLMRTTKSALIALEILANGPTPPADLTMRHKIDDPGRQLLIWTPVRGAAQYLIALRQESSMFFDEVFTVPALDAPELIRDDFANYATIAIATIDESGRMGPLTPEYSISALLRK